MEAIFTILMLEGNVKVVTGAELYGWPVVPRVSGHFFRCCCGVSAYGWMVRLSTNRAQRGVTSSISEPPLPLSKTTKVRAV